MTTQITLLALLAVIIAGLLSPVAMPAKSEGNESVRITSIHFLEEDPKKPGLQNAIALFESGKFSRAKKEVLNFGIGSQPVWLRVGVQNTSAKAVTRRLVLENAWIDSLDLHFVHAGKLVKKLTAGDRYPFSQRQVNHRFYAFDHTYASGDTTAWIRIETPDPMLLPMYLMDIEQSRDREILQGYSYGFVYGVILALVFYNAILFFNLRNICYLYYLLYLVAFIVLNLSYTGHAMKWIWPNATGWASWSHPVLMVLYGLAGLRFATRFLETREHLPRVHRAIVVACIVVVIGMLASFLTGSQSTALFIAFIFIYVFTVTMLLLGAVTYFSGQKSAKYFLLASVSAMIGAFITALAVWGAIPYNAWTYRAVEIGILIDSVLLAMALADQFRISQEEKIQAERLAKVDPLTGMNNRRGFYDATKPTWYTSMRNRRNVSVVLMDIDDFKKINDTYGHTEGDQVLICIADYLAHSAREGDVLARWGGEEFMLFLPETSLEKAGLIAERLRDEVEKLPVRMADRIIHISASFGVACRHDYSKNLDEVISVADKLLYQAKAEGRNRVCIESLKS